MNIDNPTKNFFQLPGMKRKTSAEESTQNNELRLPLVGFLPNRFRNHFVAMVGEFLGTFLFLFFAFAATQVANRAAAASSSTPVNHSSGSLAQVPNANTLLYISLAFGFSLAVNAWVFFRISGGLFNPAVTLGMALIGAVPWVRAGLIFISQMCGAMASAGIVSAMFPGPLNVTTTLGGDTSIARGLFIEMFLTFELVFTIFMLAAEKHKGTFLAPVGIGLALFIAELAGVYFTGGSLNPARSFGPCVANRSFPGYHWIYWLGPALGSILAAGFYRFVKILEYETANPGQDFNEKEAEVFNFDEDIGRAEDVSRPNIQVGAPDGTVASLGSPSRGDVGQVPGYGDRLSMSREGRPSSAGKASAPGGGYAGVTTTGGSTMGSAGEVLTPAAEEDTRMHPGYGNDQVFRSAALVEGGELADTYRPASSGVRGSPAAA